ncbi:fumarylacetoacetate hydrolase family protein [Burkholderia pseudomultivorans]|uniref:fumarylacetoacetate hydrolase family protein n=1 Tax=Burkholderia pseudomultivorans TaxID=1207504 RepID=UPI00188E6957|nr:fumarylacetoacetate hydrolase family protein [Burkholderia pseudomultivorans]MBF5014538.1 fumarylacetoacetate hydrolase family protein [Burkholderia pseudomultivorans]
MALHVLHYRHQGRAQWGVVRNRRITPIPDDYPTTGEFVRAHQIDELAALGGETIPESDVEWLSPVTRNQRFVCQGANYRQHMIESGMNPDAKSFNMIFTKASSCIVAADSDVIRPQHVQFLDYEIELGLVLRRDITSRQAITDQNLHEYVAGLVIVNDYSARDIQIPQMQFYKGKSYRTFGPVGPYLCLLDASDIPRLGALTLTLSVNGEVRQSDSTGNLVYGPAETITELSGVQDLSAGDLLATGTPSGCALSIPSPAKQRIAALLPEQLKWRMFEKVQAERPQYLKAGDLVESRIGNSDGTIDLGVQRNRIVDE